MKLRLGFADTFDNAKLFFTWVLSKKYDVILDDVTPDYLIYGDSNFGTDHKNFPNCIKVFYTGEPVDHTYAGSDPAITFDHVNSPKHYRLPLYVLDMWAAVYDDKWTGDFFHLINNRPFRVNDFPTEGTRPCSYVQTNPNQLIRTGFVEELLKAGLVDCGGPHLNNMGYVVPRQGGHTAKINFIKDRPFNIAFENGTYPGYVTEKILNAFYANVVPVYWGSTTVARDFNPEAFIDARNYKNSDYLIEDLRRIISDESEYEKFLHVPVWKDGIPPSCTDFDLFLDWFDTFIYVGE